MRKAQKGFTLVELIVVITILAILGTIAFISLQGYSQDARDSKVVSDVRNIASVVETSITESTTSIHGLVGTAVAANQVTAVNDGTATFLDGQSLTGSTYTVGEINFIALKQDGTDFGTDYRIGTLTQTIGSGSNTESYKMYQVVGAQGSTDSYTATVKGNFIYTGTDATGLVASETGSTGLQDGDSLDNNAL